MALPGRLRSLNTHIETAVNISSAMKPIFLIALFALATAAVLHAQPADSASMYRTAWKLGARVGPLYSLSFDPSDSVSVAGAGGYAAAVWIDRPLLYRSLGRSDFDIGFEAEMQYKRSGLDLAGRFPDTTIDRFELGYGELSLGAGLLVWIGIDPLYVRAGYDFYVGYIVDQSSTVVRDGVSEPHASVVEDWGWGFHGNVAIGMRIGGSMVELGTTLMAQKPTITMDRLPPNVSSGWQLDQGQIAVSLGFIVLL
jgi:hypothetical protein